MHYTVELLVRGDRNVSEFYRAAVGRWKEIWSRPNVKDVVYLATTLSDEQLWFERNCGGRWIGQEIMVVSGIGLLYSTGAGFEDKADRARLLYDAFQRSYCSVEVKSIAREVAESYGLLEERVA
jgi:hypothetical protein